MECPYCEMENFVPEVVFTHTEYYGGGIKYFRCLHCERVVQVVCQRTVRLSEPRKTDHESDWG